MAIGFGRRSPLVVWAFCLAVGSGGSGLFAQGIDPGKLPGLVLDDTVAVYQGTWRESTHTKPFVGQGYQHDDNQDRGAKTATFTARVAEDGYYRVLFSYPAGSNRATNVPITIHSAEGEKTVTLNQRQAPPLGTFADLGEFEFHADADAVIVVSNEGANGHVIVDAIQIVDPAEFLLVQQSAKNAPATVARNNPAAQPKESTPPAESIVKFEKAPATGVTTLTPDKLDQMLGKHLGDMDEVRVVDDEVFLRRVTLDIAGRQPTVAELQAFMDDGSKEKRTSAVERLLASEDYGRNWGNYWSDVIGSRQQEPQLTFHDYTPFRRWLAGELNQGVSWDEMTFQMLTASGKVEDNPAGTFIAFHQADAKKLAGETSRVFVSVQVACAECHVHPFIDMPMETFHGMAAFFVRTDAKIPWNESGQIELVSKDKGEHKIPGQKGEMKPIALHGVAGGAEFDLDMSDLERRAALAHWIVHPDNPYFARSYVNRVFARLMGRGFYDPVDEMGELAQQPILPDVHQRLADHFIASGYDHKDLVRLLTGARAYQRDVIAAGEAAHPLAAARVKKLRGDEIFDSLVTAISLPNIQPEKAKPNGDFRFPVPPKSTRDLVNEAFGYDPSFPDDLLVRTMKQAMFMMNNEQLQKQIDARPESETFLAQLLADEADDQRVVTKLYQAVLARSPSDKELGLVLAHVKQQGDRGSAFEDVLWSLVNSAEFVTRR